MARRSSALSMAALLLALSSFSTTGCSAARLGAAQGFLRTAVVPTVAVAYLPPGAADISSIRVELLPQAGGAPESGSAALQAVGAVAYGEYVPQKETDSNFGKLRIETSARATDEEQIRAMGYLEGWLTAEPIWDHWSNMQAYLRDNTNKTDQVLTWMSQHRAWMEAQIAALADTDSFFAMQRFIWQQLEGLVAGYNAKLAECSKLKDHGAKPLTFDNLLLLNTFGDMDDLLVMAEAGILLRDDDDSTGSAGSNSGSSGSLKAGGGAQEGKEAARLHPRWHSITPAQARRHIGTSGHCSALIKVTSDLSDILIGHTTWWSYTSLLRLYKHYVTSLSHPAVATQRLSFSSYPGLVHSLDDFMIASSGLVVVETSNDIYDLNLYQLSSNKAALSWQRFRASIMVARSGADFAGGIQTHNSGTYNNQYAVVDLTRFKPGQQLAPGLLTIIETLPGGAYSADTTQELERGYFPSYNIPYFSEVYNKTGVPDVRAALMARGEAFHGLATGLSYQIAPRAKIFRRDAGSVHTLADLKALLRSNGWTSSAKNSDPFSPTPWDAICARGDLDPEEPVASGCYDAKVTSYRLAMEMSAEAVNGPAWDGDGSENGKPAFSWRDWKGLAHQGMITTFNTVFELMEP